MPKFTMLSGPSGSGKSTVARTMMQADPNLVRINRDDIRAMSIHGWKSSKEEWIIEGEKALARTACRLKKNVVIDDTNLTDSDRARWSGIAQEFPTYQFQTQVVNPGLEVCLQRDSLRTGPTRVGRAVIERQFLRGKLWDIPKIPCPNCGHDPIDQNCTICGASGEVNKPTCIFDIDGTLADLEHRIPWITVGAVCPACEDKPILTCQYCKGSGVLSKKYHDIFYQLVELDRPIDIVVKWIKACYDDYHVVIVSGRSPENGTADATVIWLAEHDIKYHHLIMRRDHHHGPDTDEKQLILNDILKIIPTEEIAFVVDDRPSVVQMWRDNGLRVIPVRGRDDDKFYTSSKESKEIVCH